MGPAMHAQGLGTGSDGGSGRMSSSTLLREFFPTLTMMAVSLLVGCVFKKNVELHHVSC